MNRKIIIIITGILIVLVAFFGIRAGMRNSGSTATSTPNGSSTPDIVTSPTPAQGEVEYVDPGKRFTFNHPADFAVKGPTNAVTYSWRSNTMTTGYLLASLTVPKSFMPGTNFSEAKFTVGQSNSPVELGSTGCPSSVEARPGVASAVTINGQAFTKLISTDAAAGNLYETTGYYTIRDGDCYAIEYTIHSTNIGNYDPSQGIKEFDHGKIASLMEAIVKSFTFTVKSE